MLALQYLSVSRLPIRFLLNHVKYITTMQAIYVVTTVTLLASMTAAVQVNGQNLDDDQIPQNIQNKLDEIENLVKAHHNNDSVTESVTNDTAIKCAGLIFDIINEGCDGIISGLKQSSNLAQGDEKAGLQRDIKLVSAIKGIWGTNNPGQVPISRNWRIIAIAASVLLLVAVIFIVRSLRLRR